MSRATHLVGTADLHQSADPPGRRSARVARPGSVLMGQIPNDVILSPSSLKMNWSSTGLPGNFPHEPIGYNGIAVTRARCLPVAPTAALIRRRRFPEGVSRHRKDLF